MNIYGNLFEFIHCIFEDRFEMLCTGMWAHWAADVKAKQNSGTRFGRKNIVYNDDEIG